MFILLAESKTMRAGQQPVSEAAFHSNSPVFETIADKEMAYLSNLRSQDIAELMGISQNLAVKSLSFAYDFPNKSVGYPALIGFTGEAYRGLDVETLSESAVNKANTDLKIISSLYGLLNSTDIIKPYRLEFKKPIYPDNQSALKIYKQKVTVEFVKQIKNTGTKEIINLLPGDADALLDWKIIRAFAKVYKINFQKIDSEGKLRTPIAKRLKELRGLMCRHILENDINSFDQLRSSESSHFIYSPDDSKPLWPVFIVAE